VNPIVLEEDFGREIGELFFSKFFMSWGEDCNSSARNVSSFFLK